MSAAADIDRFEATRRSLGDTEASVLALLAVGEPFTISRWTEVVGRLGLRETATRAFSTTTLRPIVDRLVELGVVTRGSDHRFWCAPRLGSLALRWAVTRSDFEWLVNICAPPHLDAHFAARVAVAARSPDALPCLERLVLHQPERAQELALDLTQPFDPAGHALLSPPLRESLLDLAFLRLERGPVALLGPYPHFAACRDDLALLSRRALAAFAGTALQRGDVDLARDLERSETAADLRPLLEAALAVVDGRYAAAGAAARSLPPPVRADHAGTLFLLATFALWLDAPGSDSLARNLAHGGRKGAPLQQTFRVFAAIASPAGAIAPVQYATSVTADRLTGLLQTLRARDGLDDLVRVRTAELARDSAATLGRAGFRWVAEQYAHAAWELYQRSPERARALVQPPPGPPAPDPIGPPLFAARSTRQAWEIQLDRLETIAPRVAAVEERFSADRIVWRVFGRHGLVEPHLQRRSAAGRWSAGRKLALKHLLPGGSARSSLPPEDLRVAEHVREERRPVRGYPVIDHILDARAWLALVGHPRVYGEDEDHPRQVVRGEPRLSVRSDGEDVIVGVDPPDLRPGVSVRSIDDKLVVFDVDDALKGLVQALPAPLRVPPEGRERLATWVERVAALLPVETSQPTGARSVEADPRPCVRLTPSRGGLSVALLVRPLGPKGVLVAPGRGATTLLGPIGGETVQTARDLAREEARALEVVEACPVLAGRESGELQWHVEEPEACLELVSVLRHLGEAITVEWPHGSPLRLRATVGRRALQGKLRSEGSSFTLEAALTVDGELSLDLAQILDLLAAHPGRFVRLASGDYVELEDELREVLDGLLAARTAEAAQRGGHAVPAAAISVLDALTAPGGALALDARSSTWRKRFDEVFAKVPRVPRSFQGQLRDYQLEGFRWLARLADLGLGACLADDMGLGKTVQIAALLLHRAPGGPALVVAPTSVCENWRRELARFAPTLSVRMAVSGADREAALKGLGRRDVVVTSYALLQQDGGALQAIRWSTVVLDEAQLIKNAETRRAQAAFGLRADARIVATGTPVENHAGDLFSLFHFLNPGLLGTSRAFATSLAAGGASARARKRLLQPFVLRRTKAQVLDDLPPLTEIQRTVVLTPGEAGLYESVRKAALARLKSGGGSARARITIFAELTRLRRLCCHPGLVAPEANLTSSKLESFLELVEELVAARHRALVFSQFTDVLALVRPLLEARRIAYQYLDGSTPPKQRAAAVDAFQDGEGEVFLISLKAGGFGLNLTGADYVVHLDPWWNPAVESQASDRAHRIGQTRPVTVYRLVTAGTIEERIVELHREKRELADEILQGTDRAGSLTADELRGLLGEP